MRKKYTTHPEKTVLGAFSSCGGQGGINQLFFILLLTMKA
jgi:hypothetical protein